MVRRVVVVTLCFFILGLTLARNVNAQQSPPAFSLERTASGTVWCKFIPGKRIYIPIQSRGTKAPTPRAPEWQSILKAQKSGIKKQITELRRKISRTGLKQEKAQEKKKLIALQAKLLKIDQRNQWRFDGCAEATARLVGRRNELSTPTSTPEVAPTERPVPSPTPMATVTPISTLQPTATTTPTKTPRNSMETSAVITILQNEQKNVTLLENSGVRLELLPSSLSLPSKLSHLGWSCNVSTGSLRCQVSNGTFVGQATSVIVVKQLFSEAINDYQIITVNVVINAVADLNSFTGLQIPSAVQLVNQFIDDRGIGIRPWEKTVTGLLSVSQNSDPVAVTYRDRLLNSLTRRTGSSIILKPLAPLNNLPQAYNYLDTMRLCRYLETPLISAPVSWHVLNPDGTAATGPGGYLFKTYQPNEMRTLVLNYLVKALLRYASFNTWYDGNAEILRSMIAIEFAEGYSCVRDEISESQRSILETALRTKYIEPTLARLNAGSWPVDSNKTVDTGNQGIEMAGTFILSNAVLMKESPESSAANIVLGLNSLSRFLNVLYAGGSLEEGAGYHARSFGSLIRLDESLWRTFGTNFGLLSPHSAVSQESSLWSYHSYGPGGYLFAFSDANANNDMINPSKPTPWGNGIGLYLAELFNDPKQAITEIGKLRADWPGDNQFLYYKPYNEAAIFAATPKDYVSSGYPLFATRSDQTPNGLYMAAVGMIHGWIHNQKSPGTYEVHWKGVPFVTQLGYEKASVNLGFDGASYWTQTARRYDLLRNSTLGSNSLILTSPSNVGYILTNGRPAGYESDTDPTVVFSNPNFTNTQSSVVLDMTRAYVDFNATSYALGVQQGWPLPANRFVQKAVRGYGLDRSNAALPWSYVCDDTQYSGSATTKIGFNTPASVSFIGANQYRLTYQQPIDSVGGTRSVAMIVHVQSSQPVSVAVESLNDLSSNMSRYPSWWPKTTPGWNCDVDSTQPACFIPTHLPSMNRFNVTTTGTTAQVCLKFVPDTGSNFVPPQIGPVSTW